MRLRQIYDTFYFARMKNVNRGGAAVRGWISKPRELTIDDVIGLLVDPTLVVLDTRADRAAFVKAHLPGSLFAPAKGSFGDFAGSYLGQDERIILVVDSADQVEEQVRRLTRIGFNKVEGWLCFAALAPIKATLVSIRSANFSDVPALIAEDPDILVLDVRSAAEYAARHIKGALSIVHTRLQARVAEVPVNRTVIVYCQSGNRATASSAYLERNGRRTICVNDAFGNIPAELLA